jgi:hypothetical protein
MNFFLNWGYILTVVDHWSEVRNKTSDVFYAWRFSEQVSGFFAGFWDAVQDPAAKSRRLFWIDPPIANPRNSDGFNGKDSKGSRRKLFKGRDKEKENKIT